jgi:chromosomal replication initiation ATPase DnaA
MPALVVDIVRRVSFETGVTAPMILGDLRERKTSRARFAVYWVARRALGRSLPQIGAALNSRDHTTILHGLGRAEVMRDSDPAFRLLTDRLLTEFQGDA